MKLYWVNLILLLPLVFATTPATAAGQPTPAMSTEAFLNTLGVNTHLNGLTKGDPWDTDPKRVGRELKYLGVRLDRDWAWSDADGTRWKEVQKAWGPLGGFWTSVDEASPADQRKDLATEERIALRYPGLISAMGGPNEEDDAYPQSQGARLPDSVRVQQSLYDWAHAAGRSLPVSQMEFGTGWTAQNDWEGDYDPQHPGINLTDPQNGDQRYVPAQANLAAAHTYLSNPQQLPKQVLDQLRRLAALTTPGRPVAHTEFGAYQGANLSDQTFGQYLVMGAFDSAAAGDAGYLVYGLQDSAPEQTQGFYTYPGGQAHPAAVYYHTLTSLLATARKSYGPGAKPTFQPGALAVEYDHPDTVSHLLLQKPTGEYVIAAWSEQGHDGHQRPVTETVHFSRAFASVAVYDVEQGMQPVARQKHAVQTTLDLQPNDLYLLILSGAAR